MIFTRLNEKSKGDMEMLLTVMPEINQILDYEIKFWELMQNTNKFPTIMGLVNEYKKLNLLVQKIGAPAISRAIYEHEKSIMIELLCQYIIGNEIIIE